MEEGGGVVEGACVEVERAGEEERLRLLVLLPWEGLEAGLCDLEEAAM